MVELVIALDRTDIQDNSELLKRINKILRTNSVNMGAKCSEESKYIRLISFKPFQGSTSEEMAKIFNRELDHCLVYENGLPLSAFIKSASYLIH